MKNVYLFKSSLIIKIALGIAILLIVYITSIFFTQMQNLGSSFESMSTSNKRLLELEKILTVVSVNESSARSFLITKDSTYLQKRFYPESSLDPQFTKLRQLALKSPTENFTCDSLKKLVSYRYKLFAKVLDNGKKENNNAQLNYILSQSDSVTDQIRDYLYRSMDNEVTNVNLNEINHKYEIETSVITSFLLVTIALFILLLSLNRINSDLTSLKRLNDELKFLNYTFNNAEKIAGISHWKYNLQTRTYIFSDNFYHMLGINPEHFEPSLENVLPYIHQDDRERVIEAYTDSFLHKKPTSLIYRLCTKSGEIRYIKSVGSFAENSLGQTVKIGVNYDITEQHLNTVSLEENNKRLTAINAELESFNNIVSHDLQEPLRKIQMFISRIDETELPVLSETGKDYFRRISLGANRMQNLLIDLVNYSRTVKGDKIFETTDLNKVLKDVANELALNIQEKKAMLKIGKLPVVEGIPFQLHQLFINLLSNSLKFAKQDVPAKISVSASKIEDKETYEGMIFTDENFHKIIVTDNGIGFKQDFADKIFHLFRRLEKDTYQGTGIGLAICRKIAENHNGFLFAEGVPGKGAKFILYLPK